LNFEFNEDQKLIQRTIADFSDKRIAPTAAERDRSGEFHLDILCEMADLGLLGMSVPEEYGGSGAGMVAYALAMMEIARGDASVAISMSVTSMVAEIVYRLGTEEQRRKWLPLILSGDRPCGAFAITEPQAGSEAVNLHAKAVSDGGDWIINGAKQFITNGETASVVLVMAVTDPEAQPKARRITSFLVRHDNPGMQVSRREEKMGLRSSNTVALNFDNCRVSDEDRLGDRGYGFITAMTTLDSGRLGVASQAIGVGEAALAAAVNYAKEREQFGKPIGKLQAIQWMLADCRTELDAAKLLLLRAAVKKDKGERYTREASMAKLYASEAANRVANKALQIHGGYGYTMEYPLERYLRDLKVTTLYEGTSEVQRLVIARDLLRD